MGSVPTKAAARIVAGLKQFQPIVATAKSRDVNESDTVVIVTDMLAGIFGYDKYNEVTSEHAVRSTFCDLAIRLDGSTISFLIEVKAIGTELKENHVKQAVDYAANQGVDWVVLTSGIVWRAYKIAFTKPIEAELVLEFNICDLNPKAEEHVEMVYLLAKEGWNKSQLSEYHSQRQALSRFSLAALILSEPILSVMRRELKRMSPGIRIETDQIDASLRSEVIKRDVLEGEKADAARRSVSRAAKVALRKSDRPESDGSAADDECKPAAQDSVPPSPAT